MGKWQYWWWRLIYTQLVILSTLPLHFHRSAARNASNMGTQLGPPVMGDARAHTRAHGGHIYQQSVPSSAVRGSPFPPVRRTRPRGLALTVAPPSSAEPSAGFYGFSVSGSVSRSVQDGENIGRHFDRTFGWGRDSFPPLPWIPLETESQWWGPFNPPNPNAQPGTTDSVTRNFFPQRPTSERATQSRQDNGYQRIPPPAMPPFMWEALELLAMLLLCFLLYCVWFPLYIPILHKSCMFWTWDLLFAESGPELFLVFLFHLEAALNMPLGCEFITLNSPLHV